MHSVYTVPAIMSPLHCQGFTDFNKSIPFSWEHELNPKQIQISAWGCAKEATDKKSPLTHFASLAQLHADKWYISENKRGSPFGSPLPPYLLVFKSFYSFTKHMQCLVTILHSVPLYSKWGNYICLYTLRGVERIKWAIVYSWLALEELTGCTAQI